MLSCFKNLSLSISAVQSGADLSFPFAPCPIQSTAPSTSQPRCLTTVNSFRSNDRRHRSLQRQLNSPDADPQDTSTVKSTEHVWLQQRHRLSFFPIKAEHGNVLVQQVVAQLLRFSISSDGKQDVAPVRRVGLPCVPSTFALASLKNFFPTL